jgi:hypothetical protein
MISFNFTFAKGRCINSMRQKLVLIVAIKRLMRTFSHIYCIPMCSQSRKSVEVIRQNDFVERYYFNKERIV